MIIFIHKYGVLSLVVIGWNYGTVVQKGRGVQTTNTKIVQLPALLKEQ